MKYSIKFLLLMVVIFCALFAIFLRPSNSLRQNGKKLEFLVVEYRGQERVTLQGMSAKSYLGYLLDSTSNEFNSLNQIPYLKASLLDQEKHPYATLYITSQVGVDCETSLAPLLAKLGEYESITFLDDVATSQVRQRRRVSGPAGE